MSQEPSPKTPQTDTKSDLSTGAGDPYIDRAVEEIKRHDADELLHAKDEEIAKAFEPPTTRWQRLKNWLRDVWAEPKWRYSIISGLAAILVGVILFPPSRYFVLNNLGARANATILVRDDKTTEPVKNAVVELAGQSVKTDENGQAKLAHMKLGPTTLRVKKAAYAEVRINLRLGLGANDLGTKTLTATGARLQFKVVDWLSKQPLADAEAVLGDSSALANDKGVIELPIEASQDGTMSVTIQSEHYLKKQVNATLAEQTAKEVPLVISYPEYFVSNRSGKFDLYRSNVDGSDEKIILAGTGRESAQELELSMPGSHKFAALISKRDAEYNRDGYQLSTLTLIDTSNDTAKKITTSEEIYGVGWDDNHLIYVKIAAGASAANVNRHRLVSYDLVSGKEKELAASNYFASTLMMREKIYFTPTDIYAATKRGIYQIQTDGGSKQAIFDNTTWGVYRTDWDQLTFQTPEKWYSYSLSSPVAKKLDQAPGSPKSISFQDNSDHTKSLWFEERDGKGTVLLRDTAAKSDKVIRTQSGMKSLVGWVGDRHVIYRVATPAETADYVASIDGGTPVKIKDVFNVSGQVPRY